MDSFQAGLATLPVAAAAVVLSPLITPIVAKIGARTTIGVGFVIMTAACIVLAFVHAGWGYALFVVPLIALAVGMSLQNGPCSSISTSCVEPRQVAAASGISNMARYVGSAVMTAIIASVYAGVDMRRTNAGWADADALAAAFSWSMISMGIWCALGITMVWLFGRLKPKAPTELVVVQAAAGTTHTITPPEGR
ncbi:MFS transporter [Agromyces archimandritae]|uniref:MFS transporter n=1 Tax=Agromyces archimandritae TaxID=2781962 RepID=UPI001FD057C2|nr:MFS transporter [Agromyces archimandritae]